MQACETCDKVNPMELESVPYPPATCRECDDLPPFVADCPACWYGRVGADDMLAFGFPSDMVDEDDEGTTMCPFCDGTENITEPDDLEAAFEFLMFEQKRHPEE